LSSGANVDGKKESDEEAKKEQKQELTENVTLCSLAIVSELEYLAGRI
jgi:hypothetical protein